MLHGNCSMEDLSVSETSISRKSKPHRSSDYQGGRRKELEEEEEEEGAREEIMDDWFAGVPEEDYYNFNCAGEDEDADLDSLLAVVSSFVPPPPRPPFMTDEEVPPSDGLTTCDLCSWALRNDRYTFSLDGTMEAPGELGWLLTLIIVSLISAGIGAVIMVTLLHCRRLKSTNRGGGGGGGGASCCLDRGGNQEAGNPVGVAGGAPVGHHHMVGVVGGGGSGLAVIPDRPPLELDKLPPYHDVAPPPNTAAHNVNVWSWLGSRRGGGPPGCVGTLPQHHRRALNLPVENHYTHMQTDEALYAELDSQAASYASGSEDKHYHELDAVGLHRHVQHQDTLCSRHTQRLEEPDYEMYENGPVILLPTPPPHLNHHHHHHVVGKHHHHQPPSVQQQPQQSQQQSQPSYQNTAYTGSDAEPDGPSTLSSAPSSAYYSDLSSNSNQHIIVPCTSTIHVVDPDGCDAPPIYESAASHYRLTAINESSSSPTCPSDYI